MYAGITKIFPINLQYLPEISQALDFDSDRCKMYVGITKIFPINLPEISQAWDFDSDRCKMYVGITKFSQSIYNIYQKFPKFGILIVTDILPRFSQLENKLPTLIPK